MAPHLVWIGLGFLSIFVHAADVPSVPERRWELDKGLRTPESTLYDAANQCVYVSNVVGDPKRADGDGYISKISPDGKMIAEKWAQGMSAPKGMRISNGSLWVSDIQHLVQIDLKTGQIALRVFVPSARFLNDVAIGPLSEVYVSDTLGSRIYKYDGMKTTQWMTGDELESPNGLLVKDGKLIVASWGLARPDFTVDKLGGLYSIDLKTREKLPITTEPLGNMDGLELDAGGNFLASDWVAGKVFRVTPEGKAKELLSGISGAADIGWIPDGQTLLVPSGNGNRVFAYRIL